MLEILVIKPSSFGDIVHALQVVESLRRGLPGARISWVAATAFAPLVRVCDTVDVVYEFRRRGGFIGFLRLIAEVRRKGFDYVLDMQGLARSAFIARSARARAAHKIGRRDGREGARLFCPRVVDYPPGGLPAHAVKVLLQYLPVFGLAPTVTGRVTFSRAPVLREGRFSAPWDGPTFVFFPESRRPEKNWPGFAELAERLLEQTSNVRIIWSGRTTPPGFEQHAASGRFLDGADRIPLDALPGLFGGVDGVVSNDSGPMHLAAAMDRRAFALFGPTDPVRFGPWPPDSPRHRIIQAEGGDLRRLEASRVVEIILEAGLSDETRSTGGSPPV